MFKDMTSIQLKRPKVIKNLMDEFGYDQDKVAKFIERVMNEALY